MLIQGSKIKLIKPIGVFKNVGEICEVVDIAEGGVISFRFGGCHLGCMSYDEFLKYFEQVEERVWSNWEETRVVFYDMNDKKTGITLRFRNNGKKVQVRSGALKAESSCHSEDRSISHKLIQILLSHSDVTSAKQCAPSVRFQML